MINLVVRPANIDVVGSKIFVFCLKRFKRLMNTFFCAITVLRLHEVILLDEILKAID